LEAGKSGWWRSTAFVVGCGCLIALITYGLRTSFGLFATPISEGRGWSPEVFALAIAIQNIVWGLGQPFAGAVADRYGSARILAAGGVVYAAGVALMAVSPTPLAFNLTAGVLVGLGLSGASFTIVIAALGRLVPADRSSQAMGLATAAGSLGQFVFAPLGQAFLADYGWQAALLLLAGIYLARAVVIAVFITLPPTPAVVLVFAAAIGVLWLSTVPLTSGLVAVMFGTRYLGTLFGIVFLSHQVGAFLGVWLGGLAIEQTGSFMPVWWAGIVLAIVAAGLHWPIVERPAPSFVASAQAGS
jgi:predicted MFS family arabinose efflux permease